MSRSTIEIEVLGLEQLQALNSELKTYNTRLLTAQQRATALSGTLSTLGTTTTTVTQNFYQFNQTVNQTTNVTNRASGSARTLFGSMLLYRGLGVVYQEVQQGIQGVVKELGNLEKQQARVSRVTSAGDSPLIKAGMAEEISRTSASVKEVGEAFYQAGTMLKDADARFAAVQATLNLVVGAEADARESGRLLLQIFEQFGPSLDKTVSQAEQMRRIGELVAITFRDSASEASDLANALKYLGPIAQAAGVPLQQVTGLISAMTGNGVRGRMAGTETAQFLSSILSRYNKEEGGIVHGDKVYRFKLETIDSGPNKGGVDLLRTLENIVKTANSLPTEKAREFNLRIGGTQNAFRFLGSQSVESLRQMREEIEKADKALQGQTHEAEKLKEQMMTTGQEMQRVWLGAISAIDGAIQHSVIKEWLKELGDDFQAINQATLDMAKTSDVVQGVLSGDNKLASLKQQKTILHEILTMAADAGQEAGHPAKWSDILKQSGDLSTEMFGQPSERGVHLEKSEQDWFTKTFGVDYNAPLFVWQSSGDVPWTEVEKKYAEIDAQIKALEAAGASHARPKKAAKSSKLSIDEIARLAMQAGFSSDNVAMATAIALAESGGDPSQTYYNKDARHTHDRGLWQINSFWHNEVSDADAYDPMGNARAAARISGGGSDWSQWSTFRSGAYKKYIDQVRAELKDSLGGLGAIGDSAAGREKKRKAEEKRQEEIDQKRKEALELARDNAQNEYDLAKKEHGPLDARTKAAAQKAQKAAEAAAEGAELFRLRKHLDGPASGQTQDEKGAQQEAADRKAGLASYYASIAPDKYGLLSPIAQKRAQEAQEAAIAAELAKDKPDPAELMRLRANQSGPLHDFFDKIKTELDKGSTFGFGPSLSSFSDLNPGSIENTIVKKLLSDTDGRLRGIDLSARPNNIFGDQQAEEKSRFEQRLQLLNKQIAQLEKIAYPTQETAEALKRLKAQAEDAEKGIRDLGDTATATAFERRVKAEDLAEQSSLEAIEKRHGLKFKGDENEAFRDELQKLREERDVLSRYLDTVKSRPKVEGHENDAAEVQKRLDEADRRVKEYPQEYARQRYNDVRQQVQQQLTSSVLTAFHGKGDLLDIFKSLGSSIVDTAISQQVKALSDPLVNSISNEILALQGLQEAVKQNTNALQGGASGGGGGGGGGGSADPSGAASRRNGKFGLQQGIGAALGAYSIFANGQQNGITAGGVLGGALAGMQIGSAIPGVGTLVGGIVGAGLDILGGLFGHRKTVDPVKEFNPALTNAPSDFDYWSYRYRSTGQLPTQAEASGYKAPSVVNNIYVDGVKQAVNTAIANQTASNTTARTSTYYNTKRPI